LDWTLDFASLLDGEVLELPLGSRGDVSYNVRGLDSVAHGRGHDKILFAFAAYGSANSAHAWVSVFEFEVKVKVEVEVRFHFSRGNA
jgi:hypothetical protein